MAALPRLADGEVITCRVRENLLFIKQIESRIIAVRDHPEGGNSIDNGPLRIYQFS